MALRNQPPEAYELLDQRDEEQILAEIKGNIITEMFYSFPIDGKEVTGVSYVGTKEIARRYGHIKMGLPEIKDMGDFYAASVLATDLQNDLTMAGVALCNKNHKSGKPNIYAYTISSSKAQRNAIRAIIPERFLIEMYEQFKKGGKPKPEPRKQVDAEVKPVEKPADKPKWDADEQTVKTTLEVNNLHYKDLMITKYGKVVRVEPQSGFPQEMFGEYDKVLKLLHAKWLGLENRWEVPAP